jgi:hypothetical protein
MLVHLPTALEPCGIGKVVPVIVPHPPESERARLSPPKPDWTGTKSPRTGTVMPKLEIGFLTHAMSERMLETNALAFVRPVPLKVLETLLPIGRQLQEIASGAPETECGQETTAELQRRTALPRKRIEEHPAK